MFADFMIRAALAGVGVAFAVAPLGCFVVWRRMAYFGESTAHAAILGVAVSLSLEMPVFAGALVAALSMAWIAVVVAGRTYAIDTVLGVAAHSALAFGLVAVSFLSGIRIDLMAYLLGDILAVSHYDLAIIWGGAALVFTLISWRWSYLLMATLNEELACASGIRPKREQLVLTLALAITVAVGIKVVGVLLIAAMLIIPPAAARSFARSPEAMAVITGIIGATSALIGIWMAYVLDTPAGPSMVCVATIIFVSFSLANMLTNRRN